VCRVLDVEGETYWALKLVYIYVCIYYICAQYICVYIYMYWALKLVYIYIYIYIYILHMCSIYVFMSPFLFSFLCTGEGVLVEGESYWALSVCVCVCVSVRDIHTL
jgi:hypothetical protein